MSATNGADVLDRVREARAAARAEGEPPPGRDRLVELLQAPISQVRDALAVVKEEEKQLARERDLAAADSGPDRQITTQAPSDRIAEPHQRIGDGDTSPADERVDWNQDNQPGASAHSLEPAPVPAKPPRRWPLILIGFAAAVSVWSGWVGLGQMCGFGVISPLPGIWDEFRINSAIALPISVEAYAAYALRVWLSAGASGRAVRFAQVSAIGSLVVGGAAQVAYHLLAAAGYQRAPWQVVMFVSLVPVLVLGLASALARLDTAGSRAGAST